MLPMKFDQLALELALEIYFFETVDHPYDECQGNGVPLTQVSFFCVYEWFASTYVENMIHKAFKSSAQRK